MSSRSHALHPQLRDAPRPQDGSSWKESRSQTIRPQRWVQVGLGALDSQVNREANPAWVLCSCVVSAGRERCRAAAGQLRLPGFGGQVQLSL